MTRVHFRRTSETGASLVIALSMVTLIGVALVGALGFATTSLRTVTAVDVQRRTAYAADAAVQTAIQALRTNATAGTTAAGTACPAVNYGAAGTQPAVAVTCQVVASRATGGPGATMPPYAIMALGSSATETGISLTPSGTLKIAGPIASSSPATGTGGINSVSAGTLDLSGYTVDARGTCSGTITVSAPADKRCSTGLSYADPGYPSQALPSPLPTPNPAATCAVVNGVLQFSPGYYTDSSVFTPANYTANSKACTTGYLYFQPGVYYFDFGFDPLFPTTAWTVATNQKIVGGQPNGWDPNTANSLPPTPGGGAAAACKTEANGGSSGVQFVFGGASHMNVTAAGATVELCANPVPTGTNQQIAIYGQPSGVSAAAQTVTRVPNSSSPTPSSGWTGLTPTNNVLPISPSLSTIDAQFASYVLPAVSGGTTASMDLTGYVGTGSVLPAGATNVSYALNVAHQETSALPGNIASLKATITPLTGAACTVTATVHSTTTLSAPVTDSLPLTTAPCKSAVGSDGYTISYAAKAASNKTFTENLDGIDIVMTYTALGVHAESGCVLTDVVNCSVVKVGTNNAKLYVWGTVYAPLASVSADFVTAGAFEFRRGVVARAVVNTGTPPADSTGSFCLGSGAPCVGPARVLLLTATVSGTVKLRALVRYVDAPALGGALQILSWNVVRG